MHTHSIMGDLDVSLGYESSLNQKHISSLIYTQHGGVKVNTLGSHVQHKLLQCGRLICRLPSLAAHPDGHTHHSAPSPSIGWLGSEESISSSC